MFKDPRMIKIFDDYIEDQKKFKEELKRLGLTSRQDLIDATKKSPHFLIGYIVLDIIDVTDFTKTLQKSILRKII